MEREQANPEFNFLFDVSCPEHAYYRWRLFSLACQDTLRRRAACSGGGRNAAHPNASAPPVPLWARGAESTLPLPSSCEQLACGCLPDGGGQQPVAAARHDGGRQRQQDCGAARRQAGGPAAQRPAARQVGPAGAGARRGHEAGRARTGGAAQHAVPPLAPPALPRCPWLRRFEDMLRTLTAERSHICAAMAFALDNAESGACWLAALPALPACPAARQGRVPSRQACWVARPLAHGHATHPPAPAATEVAEILGDSLTLAETAIPLKVRACLFAPPAPRRAGSCSRAPARRRCARRLAHAAARCAHARRRWRASSWSATSCTTPPRPCETRAATARASRTCCPTCLRASRRHTARRVRRRPRARRPPAAAALGLLCAPSSA